MQELKLAIQCTANNGQVGSYLHNGDNEPVSPIFTSVVGLFLWAAEHGWQQSDNDAMTYKRG